MTESHAIKALLQQPILSGRISQWLLQLSQYDLRMGTPRAVKSQAIADLLAQFPGEEEFPLDDEVPGEVAMAGEVREQWVMKFDGSSTTQSGVVGVVLYHEEDKGSSSLKEPSLAPYRAMAQKMEEKCSTFEIEHTPRNENQFTDALAAFGSQIIVEGDSTRIEVSKRKESIIEMLKERFQEEQCEGDWRFPIREALMKEEGIAELKVLKDCTLVRGEFTTGCQVGS